MTEGDLDAVIQTARDTGMTFHEMAGTLYAQPFYAMRDIVASGTIGTVVQVLAQKSYPMHGSRPQDEDVDGGLLCQAGVHATRFIEHVAGLKIVEISAVETRLGNPEPEGALRIAAAYMGTLENGGVFSMLANYLNPRGFGSWGNETLRIFGTEGTLEAVDGGARTRLIVGEEDLGAIDTSGKIDDYFDLYARTLLGQAEMPFTMEDELHPTRMVIRAKVDADRR
jgi:predicted dehydrogenase